MIRIWVRIENKNGLEALRHKESKKEWHPDEKLELVSMVLAGKSIRSVTKEEFFYLDRYLQTASR